MRIAAERGTFLAGDSLVVGIEFNDIAHAVHLVAIVVAAIGRHAGLAVVPACVLVVAAAYDSRFPAVTRCRALIATVAFQ